MTLFKPNYIVFLVHCIVRRWWRKDSLGYYPLYPMSNAVSLVNMNNTCHVSRVTDYTCVGDGDHETCVCALCFPINTKTQT